MCFELFSEVFGCLWEFSQGFSTAAEKVKDTFSSSDWGLMCVYWFTPSRFVPSCQKVLIFPHSRTNAGLIFEALKQKNLLKDKRLNLKICWKHAELNSTFILQQAVFAKPIQNKTDLTGVSAMFAMCPCGFSRTAQFCDIKCSLLCLYAAVCLEIEFFCHHNFLMFDVWFFQFIIK